MSFESRYKGHIALCEIDVTGQKRISEGRVLVVGAGGLGSPVCLYLAAAGVGHITVIDPDTVSMSNLQRQIMHGAADIGRPKVESARDAMLRINDTVTVETLRAPLTAENARGLVDRHDVTVDCTDNLDTRLLVSDTCVAAGKPYVFGSVRRFSGQLFTYRPGSASYRDIFGDEPTPEGDVPCAVDGVMNTVVGVVGSLQATETIKLLARTGDVLADRLLTFDAITMDFHTYRLG